MTNNKTIPTIARNLLVTTAVLGLTACASSPQKPAEPSKPDLDSMAYLEQISIEARNELRLLAQMKQSDVTKSMSEADLAQRAVQALIVPPGFERRVDLDVEGMAESVAEAVALMAGYTFEVVGDSDGHQVPVDIYLKNKPLNEALKELGAQTGDLALIEIDQNSSKLIFNYTSRRLLPDMPSQWSN